VAGLRRLIKAGHVDPEETVVAFITGAGLKTQEAVADALPAPISVQPNIASFEAALAERQAVASPSGAP
jgi:threonine synthase